MIIKAIDNIVTDGVSIIEINKTRMKYIQNTIYDLSLVDNLFLDLEKFILVKDVAAIEEIISKKLFFEIPCKGLGLKIINVYEKYDNKKYFLDELKKSYLMRGVKGIMFTWMPILSKGE